MDSSRSLRAVEGLYEVQDGVINPAHPASFQASRMLVQTWYGSFPKQGDPNIDTRILSSVL